MRKKTTILSIFLGVFMALALNVGSVKAATINQEIVQYAKKYIGTPYVWEGTTPSGLDCSGLVQYVYRNCAGISLPRDTYGQVTVGTSVSQSSLQPGDLVFTRNVEHVGIYVGDGKMIHSPQPGEKVKISSISSFYAARRVPGIVYISPASSNATPERSNYVLKTGPQAVRNAPFSGAEIVGNLKHGQAVDVYRTYEHEGVWWSLIARGVNQQWIRSAYIDKKAPVVGANARPIKTGYKVSVSSVRVRSYPDSISPEVTTLTRGSVVDIYAEYKDWYLVARGGNQQWVPKNTLSK